MVAAKKIFFMYFPYKSMVDNGMPGAWPVWTQGAPLAVFIKRSIVLLHMKCESSGPCCFGEKDFFFMIFQL